MGIPVTVALVGSLTYAIAAMSFDSPRWVVGTAPVAADLKGVAFSDATNGYAVGVGGTILRTGDGGTTWSAIVSETTSTLNAVDVSSSGAGWAVGDNGAVLASVDGGTWSARPSGTATDLLGIDFVGTTHGWVVGRGGTVIATTDGGSTWATQSARVPETVALHGVAFANTRFGWMWGDGGVVARTTDSGSTWTTDAVAATGTTLYAGAFLDARTGWVAGSGGAVRKTTDGGVTWTKQTLDTTASIRAITLIDADHAFLVGGDLTSSSGIVAGTADGGATWTLQSLDAPVVYRAVRFADADHGWVVGDGGTVLRTVPTGASTLARAASEPRLAAPIGAYARAIPSGEVLLGWTESVNATAPVTYRVWRSVGEGGYESLAVVRATDGAGFTDTAPPSLKRVAYKVSVIDPTGESSASLSTSVVTKAPRAPREQSPNMSCTGCHTVHYALANDQYPGVSAACIGCHPEIGERLSGTNASTRHDLLSADQSAHGSRILCENCHNSHILSSATPIVDPDEPNASGAMPRVTDDFCLACHDDSLPTPARIPAPLGGGGASVAGDIAATWASDVHGGGVSAADPRLRAGMGYAKGDALSCVTCHDPHGSTNPWALLESVPSKDGTRRANALLVRPVTDSGADLRLLCAGCHSLASHPTAADGGADLAQWPIDCTGCHKHGRGL